MATHLKADEIRTLPVDATIVLLQLPEDHGEGEGHGTGRVDLVDLPSLAQRGLDDVPVVIVILQEGEQEAVSEWTGGEVLKTFSHLSQ